MKKIIADRMRKRFKKVLEIEYLPDGLYLDIYSINNIFIEGDYKHPLVVIKGAYGRYEVDGKNNFHNTFELSFNKEHKRSLDFVDGMFYQVLTEQMVKPEKSEEQSQTEEEEIGLDFQD